MQFVVEAFKGVNTSELDFYCRLVTFKQDQIVPSVEVHLF